MTPGFKIDSHYRITDLDLCPYSICEREEVCLGPAHPLLGMDHLTLDLDPFPGLYLSPWESGPSYLGPGPFSRPLPLTLGVWTISPWTWTLLQASTSHLGSLDHLTLDLDPSPGLYLSPWESGPSHLEPGLFSRPLPLTLGVWTFSSWTWIPSYWVWTLSTCTWNPPRDELCHLGPGPSIIDRWTHTTESPIFPPTWSVKILSGQIWI